MIDVTFRAARREDLPEIVRLLADDPLGAAREHIGDPLAAAYGDAFTAIDGDPNHLLVVGEAQGRVVATAQLTFLPGLSRQGAWRALLEAVRVDSTLRGQRLGEAMVHWLLERARERGCRVAQLTTDRSRADAHRFYERLGFVASHVGMKLALD